jgi:endonuclease-3 related protein
VDFTTKKPRLLQLAHNIQQQFQTFEQFQKDVTREWLLKQKGVGEESADAMLCYGCFRGEMVVDTYAKRLLLGYNIEFKTYTEYKNFLSGAYRKGDGELWRFFALFHGMIVEYNKRLQKG